MGRAALILGLLCAASVANAAPAEWTLPPLPADWKDVTTEMLKEPSMEAQKAAIEKAGGTFAATIYMSDAGTGIMVATSVFSGGSVLMAELNAFMDGLRKRAGQDAREISWNVERTETMLVGSQKLLNQEVTLTTKTYIGYRDNDDLRAIAFICYGADEVCDPVVAKIAVDATGMQRLADLDLNKKKLTPVRIAWIIGGVGTLIFVLAALWKRRPRAPK